MNIWKSGIMGVVVGDALGCPVQFESRTEVAKHPVTGIRGYGTFNLPAGSWTDDSSLTLALLESIRRTGGIDYRDIMDNFVKWLDDGAFTPYGYAYDIGRGTMSAIHRYKRFHKPHKAGNIDERSNGNGSLMRIMPATLYCIDQGLPTGEAIDIIHKVGGLTHAHIRSNIACGLHYFMALAIRDCKEWYKLEDALGLQIGMPRPERIWLYIKPDKAEYCFHAVESILTEKYHREGDPASLSFASGELARRERYKYNVAKQGNDIIQAIPWGDSGIEDSKAVFQAAGNALRIIPEGWNNQQNLVDWRDVDYIWDMKATRPFTRALHKLFATDDEKGAFEALSKAVGGRFAFISYFFFLKNPERYAVMRPQWFAKQLLKLGASTTCTDRCTWENYQLYMAVLQEVRDFLQERISETVTLIDAHSFVFSLYLVDEYKIAAREEGDVETNDLETRVIVAGTEGKRIAYYTTKYERKPQYRKEAIRIHGCRCAVCGFDFAKTYGDLGKGFIEVHHVVPLYSLEEETVPNPATDMICLCPNCHRMIHRKKDGIMTVEELKRVVESRKN